MKPQYLKLNAGELDKDIEELIIALNKVGLYTKYSCCGHNKEPSYISFDLNKIKYLRAGASVCKKQKLYTIDWER